MKIEYHVADSICILEFHGNILPGEIFTPQQELAFLNQYDHVTGIVIDCSHSGVFHAVELGWLVCLVKQLKAQGLEAVLCHLTEENREILKITQLDKILMDFPDVQSAADHLEPQVKWVAEPETVYWTTRPAFANTFNVNSQPAI